MKLDPFNFFRLSNGCMLAAPEQMPFRAMFSEIVESECYMPSASLRIRSGDTVLDIGANVGLFSIWASLKVPSARILAFEAASDNYKALAKNVRRNGFKRISTHHYAVSDGNSTHATLYRGHHGGIHSIRPDYRNWDPSRDLGRRTEKVRTITLLRIFQRFNLDKVDFMKIDCEGAEYEILFSTPERILSKIRKIVGEYHDLNAERHGGILEKFLMQKGFKTEFRAAGAGNPWGMFTAIIR